LISTRLLAEVEERVLCHCASKGYVTGPNWNPMLPQDCVNAHAMARHLIESEAFDHYIAVAPEGHVYGFFFEQLGVRLLSVEVDYPPTHVVLLDDLSVLRGCRVSVNVAIHRLKRRYREILEEEILATLDDPAELADEIRSLFDAIHR
jgi:hypothetical protein